MGARDLKSLTLVAARSYYWVLITFLRHNLKGSIRVRRPALAAAEMSGMSESVTGIHDYDSVVSSDFSVDEGGGHL